MDIVTHIESNWQETTLLLHGAPGSILQAHSTLTFSQSSVPVAHTRWRSQKGQQGPSKQGPRCQHAQQHPCQLHWHRQIWQDSAHDQVSLVNFVSVQQRSIQPLGDGIGKFRSWKSRHHNSHAFEFKAKGIFFSYLLQYFKKSGFRKKALIK